MQHEQRTRRRRRSAPARVPAAERLEARRLLSAALLRDINTQPVASSPQNITEFDGALYLTASGASGRELYRSDGTAAGTTLVKDLRPGVANSSPLDLVEAGDYLYFTASNSTGEGRDLWRTDGTPGGTIRLTAATPPVPAPNPAHLTPVGNELYFEARDPAVGHSLWKTDGTPEGTVLVFDPPGADDLDPHIDSIAPAGPGGGAFFSSAPYTAAVSARLWKTDGTAAGTVRLADFGPNPVRDLTYVSGSKAVFSAEGAGAGRELWVTDGGLPQMLTDVRPGPAHGVSPWTFVNVNGTVFFESYNASGSEHLWKTDGTAEGTAMVGAIDSFLHTAWDDTLYFVGWVDGGRGLWRSDGTAAGTFRVSEVIPADDMAVSGDSLYFFVSGGSGTTHLYKSDGTEQGTRRVHTLGVTFGGLTPFAGGVAFAANDGTGQNLWTSDGTDAGTRSVGPFDPTRTLSSWSPTPPPSPAMAPIRLGGRTVFAAAAPGGGALWATDGTPGGTVRVSAFTGTQIVGMAAAARPDGTPFAYVFSHGGAGNGPETTVWTTDGTDAGTTRVTEVVFATGGRDRAADSLAVVDGVVYFSGDLPADRRGIEPMKSDGTAAGTVRIKDVYDPADGTWYESYPSQWTVAGNTVYFAALGFYGHQAGNELWKTDGTAEGTVLVKRFMQVYGTTPPPPPPAYQARALANVNGTLMFRATGSAGRDQLWKSDGTPDGTVMVREFAPPRTASYPPDVDAIAALGGAAYFVAAPTGEAGNWELWKSDGTAAGTALVKDVFPGTTSSMPEAPSAAGGRVYLSAIDPEAGRELWTSDGTEGGTYRLADLNPGAAGATPRVVGSAGGRVYFAATTPGFGSELWSTTGAAGDAQLVFEVAPGATGSAPLFATATAGGVVFWANDNQHGVEPWVDLPPLPLPSFVVGRHLFYNNSRFDGRSAAADEADDGAIAPDKQALLPGAAPARANVSGSSRGLNGLMVDLDKRLDFITGDRFTFRVGRGGDVSSWPAAPAPLAVTRRNGPAGSERVSFTWADGAIRNAWLEVTVEVLSGDRVVGTDVFYFGNLPGDTGGAARPGAAARVDAADVARTRAAWLAGGAGIGNAFDHNRDGHVNAADVAVARANVLATLQAPTPPPATAGAASTRPARGAYRPGLLPDRDAPADPGASA